MRIQWKKPFRDLAAQWPRSLLALLALILGVYGISTIVYTYSVVSRDIRDNFMATNPASAILSVKAADRDLTGFTAGLHFVEAAESRRTAGARIRDKQGRYMPITLYAVPDFDAQRINTFRLEKGAWPRPGEILIERDGMSYLNDGPVKLQLEGRRTQELTLSGTVHAPGLAPSHMEHALYGFLLPETLDSLVGVEISSRLLVTYSESRFELKAVQRQTRMLRDSLTSAGFEVLRAEIPPPGEHPHAGQLSSLLFLQLGIGALAVLLSLVLLLNVVSALMAAQIRQIGVMKATGASYRQLLGIYLAEMSVPAVLALCIALPMGYASSTAFSGFIAMQLNFDLLNAEVPFGIHLMLVAMGLLLPLAVAYVPERRVVRMPVRDALFYLDKKAVERTLLIRREGKLPVWVRLALRNLIRSRRKLTFSLVNLSLGITLILIAINVSESIAWTFDSTLEKQRYDLSLILDQNYPEQKLRTALAMEGKIRRMEVWERSKVALPGQAGGAGETFDLIAFEDGTQLWDMPMVSGAAPDDWTGTVVVNTEFTTRFPDYRVGDSLRIRFGGKWASARIAGRVRLLGSPKVFTSRSAWRAMAGAPGDRSEIKLQLDPNMPGSAHGEYLHALEARLAQRGIYTVKDINLVVIMQVLEDHIYVILFFLMTMALLVLAVGGLGLISVMNMNVMERRREIGVMRAIGGGMPAIRRILGLELLLFGLIGWGLAILLSYPLSRLISAFFGNLIIGTPLEFATDANAIWISFLIMLGMIFVSALFPFRSASKMTVREALAMKE